MPKLDLSGAEEKLFIGVKVNGTSTAWPESHAVFWFFERADIELILFRIRLLESYRSLCAEFLENVRYLKHDRTFSRRKFKVPFEGKFAFGFYCFLSCKVKDHPPVDYFLNLFLVDPSDEEKAFKYFDPLFDAYLDGARVTKIAETRITGEEHDLPPLELN
jgi:hypothetical protein